MLLPRCFGGHRLLVWKKYHLDFSPTSGQKSRPIYPCQLNLVVECPSHTRNVVSSTLTAGIWQGGTALGLGDGLRETAPSEATLRSAGHTRISGPGDPRASMGHEFKYSIASRSFRDLTPIKRSWIRCFFILTPFLCFDQHD